MAILLQVKNQKAYTEANVSVPGVKLPLTIGCKLHSNTDLTKLRLEYSSILEDDRQAKVQAQLEDLLASGDKTSDQFYSEKASLYLALTNCTLEKEKKISDWYKEQVTHILNATVQYVDESGKTVDLVVADTRTAQPIESLWADSEECLVVLLDLYFEFPGLGDSLISTIGGQVFQLSLETAQTAKSKN